MKNLTAFVFLILCFSLFSCDDDNLYYENDFENSYHEWQAFKTESENYYQYTVVGGTWVGAGWQTTITVRNGAVVQRYFKMEIPDEWLTEMAENELEWIENGTDLGLHTNTPAADLFTLDEVYELARTEWLTKKDDVTSYFETENDGLISTCGYTENNCADDCFVGIHISEIMSIRYEVCATGM